MSKYTNTPAWEIDKRLAFERKQILARRGMTHHSGGNPYTGAWGGGMPYRSDKIQASCSICSDAFYTDYNEVYDAQKSYLCPHCEENYGRNTVAAALSTTQEVDELLQEAEDYHNGIVRPKKEKPQELEKVPEMAPWDKDLEPFNVKNPYDGPMENFMKEMSSEQEQQESRSNSQSQNPKKKSDWWKILGIIIITAVVTAFFTALLI